MKEEESTKNIQALAQKVKTAQDALDKALAAHAEKYAPLKIGQLLSVPRPKGNFNDTFEVVSYKAFLKDDEIVIHHIARYRQRDGKHGVRGISIRPDNIKHYKLIKKK